MPLAAFKHLSDRDNRHHHLTVLTLGRNRMKIEAEQSRYHGNAGWDSDPELFGLVAVNPKQWLGMARDHLNVAFLLLPSIEERYRMLHSLMTSERRSQSIAVPRTLDGFYFFHCALTLENAFKSVITLTLDPEAAISIAEAKALPRALLGHDLLKLAARSKFDFDFDQEHALRFLRRYGIWAGRYPLPRLNHENGVTEMHSDGQHYLLGGYRPEQIAGYAAFCSIVVDWASDKIGRLREAAPAPYDLDEI